MIDELLESAADFSSDSPKGCLIYFIIVAVVVAILFYISTFVSPVKTKIAEKDGVVTYKLKNPITGFENFVSEKLTAEKP